HPAQIGGAGRGGRAGGVGVALLLGWGAGGQRGDRRGRQQNGGGTRKGQHCSSFSAAPRDRPHGVDLRCIGWRVSDAQASIGQQDTDNPKVICLSPYARPPPVRITSMPKLIDEG